MHEPAKLTFYLEGIGDILSPDVAKRELVPMLKHESPLVREGAIYGLVKCADRDVIDAVQFVAESDPSPGVRAAASEFVAMMTLH